MCNVNIFIWRMWFTKMNDNQKFIEGATLWIIGIHRSPDDHHWRPSSAFQLFPIQEVPLSRYWPFVGYANYFRHWITEIFSPNHWFPAVIIYILSRHWLILATRRPMPEQYLTIFGRKWMTMHNRIPGLHFFLMTSHTIFVILYY